jgi:hypothetical protein
MEFIIVYVVLAVLGLIGTVVFWGVIGTMLYKLFKGTAGSGSIGAGSFPSADADFSQALQELSSLVQRAQAGATQSPDGGAAGAQLPPELQMRFQEQLLRAQNQMGQLDHLSRQRHETFVSGMLSDASSSGLDVSGWNY